MAARKRPEPVAHMTAYLFPPPKWKDSQGAVEHLGGDFARQLLTLHDLTQLGASRDLLSLAALQLAQTAEAMATTLEHGSAALEVDDETSSNLADLVAAAELVRTKGVEEGFAFDTEGGVTCELHRETMTVLTDSIAHAAKELGLESLCKWEDEQRYRRCVIETSLDAAAARLRKGA